MSEDAQIDDIIASVAARASDDTTTLAAFARDIEAALRLPTFGLVLGERVQIESIELPNPRRGIVAVLRKGGRARRVSLLDVVLPGRSRGVLLVRAYQRWAGVTIGEDAENEPPASTVGTDTVQAIVLKVASETARLRPLGEDQDVTLRGSGSDMWKVVPGQIVSVRPNKRWTHRRYHYMSGQIEGTRIDIPAIGLKPPALHERGSTDIGEPYAANLEALWRIVAANRNVDYELERIIPGADERGADDPVLEALELRDVGDNDGAEKALMDLLQADLRCLEAHALLGAWTFETKYDSLAAKALLHFEVGVAIGEQAVGPDFDGRLPWTYVGNRPFLRCLHGFGLALWRQGRTDDAIKAFERVSTLNPNDELEARLCWRATLDGTPWSEWSS